MDVIIPRGGEGLIRFVAENSSIPVLKHYKGVCHLYVDQGADQDMAVNIAVNGKCQRPGVCNALETLLVHAGEAESLFAQGGRGPHGPGRGDTGLRAHPGAGERRGSRHGGRLARRVRGPDPGGQRWWTAWTRPWTTSPATAAQHTEAIVTQDYARAQRFINGVDSSLVLVNASTRFNDGGELGLGAEIGINTGKLHAFGPMGLSELTTTKFIAYGDGQVRE